MNGKNATLVASMPSTTGRDTMYDIHKLEVGKWTCSCPAFEHTRPNNRGQKFPCKHLRAAWKLGQALKQEGIDLGLDKATGLVVYDSSKF